MSHLIEATAERLDPPVLLDSEIDERPYRRLGVAVLLWTFGVFGVWAATAPLDSAVIATGEVKVAARSKVIQHLEGGIVSEILVKNGDRVQEGQELIRLSPINANSDWRSLRLQSVSAQAAATRAAAEQAESDSLTFPQELLEAAAKDPEIAGLLQTQRSLFTPGFQARGGKRHIQDLSCVVFNPTGLGKALGELAVGAAEQISVQ